MIVFLILALVTAQRAVELHYSNRNTRLLLDRGGHEVGQAHYPLVVVLHVVWLACLWWYGWGQEIRWPFIVIYLLLQVVRAWILMALGPRWTTRIIVMPDEPLVTTGPYRFFRHPNYIVVALEILILPFAFGLWWLALIFSVLNGALLYWRIRVEDEALSHLREDASITGTGN